MSEVKKSFSVSLDISKSISNREFSVVEGDTGNELIITLTDNGKSVDLTGCRVLALFSKSNGETVCQDSNEADGGVTIEGESANVIRIDLFASSVSPGMVESEIQVYSGENMATLITSARFNFLCRRGILNEDTLNATREYPLLSAIMAENSAMLNSLNALIEKNEAIADAEAVRVQAEKQRQSAERLRLSAENGRSSEESRRRSAESERVSEFDSIKKEARELMDSLSANA